MGRLSARERGQVAVFFALLLPVLLAMSGFVIGIGNWYVHGKNLQTKADAGAFGGGDSWEFPCGSQTDARIIAQAQQYAGPNNPQVGKVPNSSIHTVLNGSNWYDDDSNPFPTQYDSPASDPNSAPGALCNSETLDVKVTEDNSFPLASLIPLFPDIKRKARVEIQQAEGIFGLLPIAVRAPEPTSAAAVFYNEANGNILGVKYFVKANSIFGIPGGLQGWSSFNSDDPSPWANFSPATTTGVVIATSFRGACNTNLPPNNAVSKKITTSPAPQCFEDEGFSTISQLCNQGSSTQIVNCNYDDPNTNWPLDTTIAGLHFIRGYPTGGNGDAAPLLRSAYLENGACTTNGYFNSDPPPAQCTARLHAVIDIGSVVLPPPPPGGTETRVAANVEVRYRVVSDNGGNFCAFGTPTCDLQGSGGPGNSSWVTNNTLPTFDAQSGRNAIALRVRYKSPTKVGAVNCSASGNNCEFFITANGTSGIGGAAPTDAQVLAAPVQRMFMGDSISATSVKWLRLTTDQNCDGVPEFIDQEAASQTTGANHCFFMDMGLKGGLAKDTSEQPILFNDGIGSSQMGAVDCDPTIPQGKELTIGVVNGCNVWYAKHPFDGVYNPLCPSANNLFSGYPTGNPGSPWNDGRWPPIRCIKTRPTGSMNQLQKGLNERLFGNPNANSCPGDAAGFVKGRDYWDKDTNPANGGVLGFNEGSHNTHFDSGDPRIVTIFIAPTDAFAGNGQNTYPIAGFVEVYITGYGRINSGNLNIDDPCPGSAGPTDLNLGGGNASGYAMWGHFLNYRLPTPGATPSGVLCNPGGSTQPCVAVLVE